MQEEEESSELPNRTPPVWEKQEHKAPLCVGVKDVEAQDALAVDFTCVHSKQKYYLTAYYNLRNKGNMEVADNFKAM
ncbi:hypothetical protein KUCAC02_001766 [Chaenocephalus aceratus]|uniref:Uncharacterized protein n=1 Tax=Chaenocephalus aceratus TaxID=36190 RepID=A0ACB9XT03_CHAAC|nr:hypothetical protein KUCAC02_001766 [Chaenocephalus aceratus]